MASIGALFAAMGSHAQQAAASVAELKDALGEPDPHARRRRGRKGKGKKGRNLRRGGPTPDFFRRQMNKRRWLNGLPIPEADREALEAAQVERERKGAKRAYMFRRQEESKKLNAECAAYYAQVNQFDRDNPKCSYEERMTAYDSFGWPRIKALIQLWDDKMPLAIVLEAQAAT